MFDYNYYTNQFVMPTTFSSPFGYGLDSKMTNSAFSPQMGLMGNIGNMDFMSMMLQQQLLFSTLNMPKIRFDSSIPSFQGNKNNYKRTPSMPLSKESQARLNEISSKINCNPKDLHALIRSESSGNPQAVNPASGATGLIQFMPKTAKWLGTSTEELMSMSQEKQMDYVEKYLVHMKKSAGFKQNEKLDSGQLYALVFMPAKAKSGNLCESNSLAYQMNEGLDMNHDGRIDNNDLSNRISSS